MGREVQARRAAGMSADAILADDKPRLVAEYPDWEHRSLIDLEIRYSASDPH